MNKKQKNSVKINNQIKYDEVRLVGNNVDNGVYSIDDALKLSDNMELDLILISPNANPPVCKIMDYKKFEYEKKKRLKEQHKKQKENKVDIKELRFGPNTDEHDYNFKKNHAEKFLRNGDKVKSYVFFKGREIQFKDKGEIILLRLASDLSDISTVELMPNLQGNKMFMLMKPKK